MIKDNKPPITTIIVILIILISSLLSSASAWTISAGFEYCNLGQVAAGTDAFDYAGDLTKVSGTVAKDGIQSAMMTWKTGMDGWGNCHGEINFPYNVSEGGEVWFRAYNYFQPRWEWNASPVKFMRLKTGGGHLGLMAKNSIFYLSNEVADYDSSWKLPVQTIPTENGKWLCMEIYVKFSATNGIVRLWKDGVLFAEDIGPTLKPGDTAFLAYLMNTWNSPGSPKDQVQYFDHIVLTNERPSNKDSAGNYMIGPIGFIGSIDDIPPSAPMGVNAATY